MTHQTKPSPKKFCPRLIWFPPIVLLRDGTAGPPVHPIPKSVTVPNVPIKSQKMTGDWRLETKMLITPAAVKQWNIIRQGRLNSFF